MRLSIGVKRVGAGLAAVAMLGVFVAVGMGQPGAAPPAPQAPRAGVIRTFTHHQVTAIDRGVSALQPVVSDSGNRIVLGLNPAADGRPPRIATVDFEGAAPPVVLDEAAVIEQPDITADGTRVVYVVGYSEIRIVASDGGDRRTLVKSTDNTIGCPRLSGNGRVVVFLAPRGMTLGAGAQAQTFDRGVYAIDPDGRNLRRVTGPAEIAKLRGVTPDDVGNPNFGIGYFAGSLDVSSDGGRVAFGCWVKGASVLFGCDTSGANLHAIAELTDRKGDAVHQFAALALSGDASTVAYHTVYPDQLAVVSYDGKSGKVLLEAGSPDDRRFQWTFSAPVYVTLDGARVTYCGRHFNADGSGTFQLMSTHQEGVLRYLEYEQPAPDGNGRRFAYWAYEPRPLQLASMELNVPWDRLRGAPKVSELVLDPSNVPRQRSGVTIVPSKLAARVAAEPAPPKVSSSAFFKGLLDEKAVQYGTVGQTDHFDDGKAEVNGDATAGDGIYTRRWAAVYEDAPDGPRTLRVEAQVTGKDNVRHASVVEIGPYPVVPGSDQPPPAGGTTTTIDGTPPPRRRPRRKTAARPSPGPAGRVAPVVPEARVAPVGRRRRPSPGRST